jgi:hypothetical protein
VVLNLPQLHYLEQDPEGSPRSADPLAEGEEEIELDINQITDVKILTSSVTKNLHSIKHYEKTSKIGRGVFNAPNRTKLDVCDIMLIKGSITTPMAEAIVLRIKTEVNTPNGEMRQAFDVKRRMDDAHMLKKILFRRYPYLVIPPLPTSYHRLTKQHFLTLQRRVQRFFEHCLRKSEIIKADPVFQMFLKQEEKVTQSLQDLLRAEKSRELGLFNIYTEEGQVKIQTDADSAQLANKFPEALDVYRKSFSEVF